MSSLLIRNSMSHIGRKGKGLAVWNPKLLFVKPIVNNNDDDDDDHNNNTGY